MEILNVGPLELILILAVMIVFLGPKGMKELARQTGSTIRKARQSSFWKEIQRVMDETRDLPVKLVREAGIEEQMEEIRRGTQIAVDLSAPSPGEGRSPGSRLRPPSQRGRRQEPPSTANEADTTAAAEPSTPESTEDNIESSDY